MVPRGFWLLALVVMHCASNQATREQARIQEAEKGDLEMRFQLARDYRTGKGLQPDAEKALAWLGKCGEEGHLEAQYLVAEMYRLGEGREVPDFKLAAQWYRRAALRGHTDAQYQLGIARYHGLGVARDLEKATVWLDRAARAGHEEARVKLATMYAEGSLQPRLDNLGLLSYYQAAGQGSAEYQAILGWMYHRGIGVVRDIEAAREWYAKAAEAGHAGAAFQLAVVSAAALSGEVGDSDEDRAWASLYREDDVMHYGMHALYGRGVAVPAEEEAVTAWFRALADEGFPAARKEMARRCYLGLGAERDPSAALRWLRLAARDDSRTRRWLSTLESLLRQAAE